MTQRSLRNLVSGVAIVLVFVGACAMRPDDTRASPDRLSNAAAPAPIVMLTAVKAGSYLASVCPEYVAARVSGGEWSCVIDDPGSTTTARSPMLSGNVVVDAASGAGQGHVPIIDCVPETPYHCYVSKFVEFGVGIFPEGIVHIEANANFNGLESQNGVATTLLTKGEPKDAALKQSWNFSCALARPSGPRKSCGEKSTAEPDYNTRRATSEANFYYTIGRFAYTINDTFYGIFKPGPNPPGAPKGFIFARVYGYPVICYRAGTRKHPIKRCSFALFGEQR